MVNYSVEIYDSAASLETAVEAIDNTTTIQVVPFQEQGGKPKFMLIQ